MPPCFPSFFPLSQVFRELQYPQHQHMYLFQACHVPFQPPKIGCNVKQHLMDRTKDEAVLAFSHGTCQHMASKTFIYPFLDKLGEFKFSHFDNVSFVPSSQHLGQIGTHLCNLSGISWKLVQYVIQTHRALLNNLRLFHFPGGEGDSQQTKDWHLKYFPIFES